MKLQATNKEKEAPPKFTGRVSKDGLGMDFGSYTKMHLKKFMKENPNLPFEWKPLLPESLKQRAFFEGGLCPLLTYYQEGLDHRNSRHVEMVREWLKLEFNGEIIAIGGKTHKIAKSTKNKLNQGFLERVMGYLLDNYALPLEAIDPEKYKHWKDVVYSYGGADNYIDYLVELNLLTNENN